MTLAVEHNNNWTGGYNWFKSLVANWILRNVGAWFTNGPWIREAFSNANNHKCHKILSHSTQMPMPCQFLSITTLMAHCIWDCTSQWITTPNPWNSTFGEKAVLYTTTFHCTPTSQQEARVLYWLCFLPALTYPLLATWLPSTFFNKVHQLSTSTILKNGLSLQSSMLHGVCTMQLWRSGTLPPWTWNGESITHHSPLPPLSKNTTRPDNKNTHQTISTLGWNSEFSPGWYKSVPMGPQPMALQG